MTTLTPTKNPHRSEEFELKVSLTHDIENCPLGESALLKITYYPDRDLIPPKNLNDWINSFAKQDWSSWEELTGTLLKMFYDTILPLHVNFTLITSIPTPHGELEQIIELSQTQPTSKK